MEGSSSSDERLLREAGLDPVLGRNTGSYNPGEVTKPCSSREQRSTLRKSLSYHMGCMHDVLLRRHTIRAVTVCVYMSWHSHCWTVSRASNFS